MLPSPRVTDIVCIRDSDAVEGSDSWELRAAIVTEIRPRSMRLAILHPRYGLQWSLVPFDEYGAKPGQWSWPDRP